LLNAFGDTEQVLFVKGSGWDLGVIEAVAVPQVPVFEAAITFARTEGIDYIIINPAAFTHTSVALRDALLAVDIPFIEVHLSNVHARESFRHHSYFSDIARGVICGLGATGYQLALTAALEQLDG